MILQNTAQGRAQFEENAELKLSFARIAEKQEGRFSKQ